MKLLGKKEELPYKYVKELPEEKAQYYFTAPREGESPKAFFQYEVRDVVVLMRELTVSMLNQITDTQANIIVDEFKFARYRFPREYTAKQILYDIINNGYKHIFGILP